MDTDKRAGARRGTPSIARLCIMFSLASLLLVGLVGTVAYHKLQGDLLDYETHRGVEKVEMLAHDVIEPAVGDGLLAGDPAAVASLDQLVRRRVLPHGVTRVKLWSSDGTILYSDEPRLIGRRYELRPEDRAILGAGYGSDARLSQLELPENELEPVDQALTEIYLGIQAPNGRPLMFEAYLERQDLASEAGDVLTVLAPIFGVGVGVLLAVQIPMATLLARHMAASERERAALLRSAAEMSAAERRRIAGDLHDGTVQDLTGVALELSALAGDAESGCEHHHRLRGTAEQVRQSVRALRTLMTDIHPPNLHAVGLPVALADLVDRLDAGPDVEVELSIEPDLALDRSAERLLYRATQEALRNVVRHADAHRVTVGLHRVDDATELVVTDDGLGFEPGPAPEGHAGLGLLESTIEAAGGTLEVHSRAGEGTELRVRVPA